MNKIEERRLRQTVSESGWRVCNTIDPDKWLITKSILDVPIEVYPSNSYRLSSTLESAVNPRDVDLEKLAKRLVSAERVFKSRVHKVEQKMGVKWKIGCRQRQTSNKCGLHNP